MMVLFFETLVCVALWAVAQMWIVRKSRKLPMAIRIDREKYAYWRLSRFFDTVVAGPVEEEFWFRLPLILIFSQLGLWAYVGITVSAGLFALVHNAQGNLESVSWSIANIKKIWARTVWQYVLGTLFGVVAVYSHSILLAVLLHALWNFLIWIGLQWTMVHNETVPIRLKVIFCEWYAIRLRWLRFKYARK
jgi:membrane protease YdiL (CAAX protease family)